MSARGEAESTARPSLRRAAALAVAVVALLVSVRALAQVPEATVDRIVDLKVQWAENDARNKSHQIDVHTAAVRRDAIEAELGRIYAPIRRMSREVQRSIGDRVQGLFSARMATEGPRFAAEAKQARDQQQAKRDALGAALVADVETAAEIQRKRIQLQQRRDKGEISAQQFASEDRQALDQIMDLRGKYSREGGPWSQEFDRGLKLKAEAVAANPETPLPRSRVPADGGGTTEADYARDVALGAQLWQERDALSDRYWKKHDITVATFRESDVVLNHDIARLQIKWSKVGRQLDFERDCKAGAVGSAPLSAAAAPSPARSGDDIARMLRGPQPAEIPYGWILFFLFIVALLFAGGRNRRKPIPASTVHGSAHYAPFEETITRPRGIHEGVFLGKSSGPGLEGRALELPGAPICTRPEHHTLIVARTRTGKGTRVIVPTLLRYGGSALVIDPKGENAAITARSRAEQLAQQVFILNPWGELGVELAARGLETATFNPLDVLDRKDPNVVATAQTLANAICPAPPNAKDKFWQGSAANILTAVFLWITDRPEERKTLARAREIISLTRKDFRQKFLIPMAASEAFSGAIREMAAPFIDLADETYSGILSNLSENTRFLSDPQIKTATARSSFDIAALANARATVYVVIPPERMDTQKTWLRLVIIAAMEVFKRARRASGHRCLFLIDEFAALGRLDDMPRDIATMSGFGVDFALVVQGLDQLKTHYGDARETILSNCAYKWFCNLNDLESAKYLSETLGKATVVTVSQSTSSSTSKHGGSSGSSTTFGETGRPLLTPDEVLTLGSEIAIALQPDGHPHYLRPIDYWNLPQAFSAFRETHPELYWRPPLVYDENPYIARSKAKARTSNREGAHRTNGQHAGSNGKAGSNGSGKTTPPRPDRMKLTKADARAILGVAENATEAEIRAAYLALMKQVHPDHGGSNYFAKELNAAKDVLTGA